MKGRCKVVLQFETYCSHVDRVRQRVAVDSERTVHLSHVFGRCGCDNRDRAKIERLAVDGPLVNFGYSAGLGNDELGAIGADRAKVTRLSVERQPGLGMFRALHIRQERFADVAELHLFGVVERLDGWITTRSTTGPRTDEPCEVFDVSMERRSHLLIVRTVVGRAGEVALTADRAHGDLMADEVRRTLLEASQREVHEGREIELVPIRVADNPLQTVSIVPG